MRNGKRWGEREREWVGGRERQGVQERERHSKIESEWDTERPENGRYTEGERGLASQTTWGVVGPHWPSVYLGSPWLEGRESIGLLGVYDAQLWMWSPIWLTSKHTWPNLLEMVNSQPFTITIQLECQFGILLLNYFPTLLLMPIRVDLQQLLSYH